MGNAEKMLTPVSVKDFLSDEIYDLAEYQDGTVIQMSAVSLAHSRVVMAFAAFISGVTDKGCRVLGEPAKVKPLSDENIFVMPDIFVVCKDGIAVDKGVFVEGPPRLVVEVLSPSTALRDRGYKKNLYQRAGVGEYWIVDIFHRIVEVWLPAGEKLELRGVFGGGDALNVGMFAECVVPSVFEDNLFGN